MKLRSRLQRLERERRALADREDHAPFAPERWMRRFIAFDRRYADLYADILAGAERHSPGTLPQPGWPMTLDMCMFGLVHQAPELLPSEFDPTPEPTPESRRAIELLNLLYEYAFEYQRRTGDLYPDRHTGFRFSPSERPDAPPVLGRHRLAEHGPESATLDAC